MGGGGNSLISNELQAYGNVNIIDDAYSATTKLANGIKYVVKAFSSNGNLADWNVCEVGKTPPPLKLNGDQKYDIIIYSFNSSKEPPRTSSINSGFNYNHAGDAKEFLYHKISGYKAVGGKTTLNVTLKHKFSYAKFIIDARGLATHNNQDVTVSNVKLSGVHHNAGTINVNTGAFSGSGKSDIPITMTKKSAKLFESSYIPLSLNSGTTTGAFIADISAPAQHGTQKQAKRFPLNIKSGTKNTYTLKPNGNAFVPAPKCEDPDANNYGKPLPCTFPQVQSITAINDNPAIDFCANFDDTEYSDFYAECSNIEEEFNLNVNITNFDSSKYSITQSVIYNGILSEFYTKSFIKNGTDSHSWDIAYTGDINVYDYDIHAKVDADLLLFLKIDVFSRHSNKLITTYSKTFPICLRIYDNGYRCLK